MNENLHYDQIYICIIPVPTFFENFIQIAEVWPQFFSITATFFLTLGKNNYRNKMPFKAKIQRYNLTILCIQSCQNLINIQIPLEFLLVVFLNPLSKYGFLSITGYRISNVNCCQNFVRWTQLEKLTKPKKIEIISLNRCWIRIWIRLHQGQVLASLLRQSLLKALLRYVRTSLMKSQLDRFRCLFLSC